MNESTSNEHPEKHPSDLLRLARRHLAWGWGGLAVFIVLGVALEALHAFKVPLYLDVENETRRFLFRLAHAHGALLSLLQLGVSFSFSFLKKGGVGHAAFISRCFLLSLVLLPAGFFSAGWSAVDGDPGMGIVLVPAGALFLMAGTALLCRAALRSS